MRARNLDQAELSGAITDARTLWPNGFDASRAQLVNETSSTEATPEHNGEQLSQ
jgi:hypothetical protein